MKANWNIQFQLKAESPEPLYLQFKEQLKKAILCNDVPPGTQLPDLRTLAESANVSIRTAYKGMNELIKTGICQRRPKKGTFVADSSKIPMDKRKQVCGYLAIQGEEQITRDAFVGKMLHGLRDASREHGVDLLQITRSPIEAMECYSNNEKLNFLGMFALELCSFKHLATLAELYPKKRFVLLNFNTESFECTPKNLLGVFNDEFSGGYQAGEAASSTRASRIAAVWQEDSCNNYFRRLKGFQAALRDNGYNLDKQLQICKLERPNGLLQLLQHGRKCGKELALQKEKPEVVFVVNDLVAAGIQDSWRKYANDSPLMLIGYDNIYPNYSQNGHFSTVAIDFYRIGYRGLSLLMGIGSETKQLLITPQLLLRR